MTEMADKKGRLKLTVEVEVNQELMDLAKETMSKMSMKIPDLMKRSGENKQ
ncbi:MAG: hypothetical protein ACXV2C_02185 [Candidatus Bathyarchaeia archaeon]